MGNIRSIDPSNICKLRHRLLRSHICDHYFFCSAVWAKCQRIQSCPVLVRRFTSIRTIDWKKRTGHYFANQCFGVEHTPTLGCVKRRQLSWFIARHLGAIHHRWAGLGYLFAYSARYFHHDIWFFSTSHKWTHCVIKILAPFKRREILDSSDVLRSCLHISSNRL